MEEQFALQIKQVGLSPPAREFRFHPKRKWRGDFAWPELKIMVEIEGGEYSNGRHVRGCGFANDCIKTNEAQKLGWRVFRFTGTHVRNGYAIQFLEEILK